MALSHASQHLFPGALSSQQHSLLSLCESRSKPRRTSHRPWKTAQLRCGYWAAGRLLEVTVHDAGERDTAIYSPSTQTLQVYIQLSILEALQPLMQTATTGKYHATNQQTEPPRAGEPLVRCTFFCFALSDFSSASPPTSISDEGEVSSWVPAPSWHV